MTNNWKADWGQVFSGTSLWGKTCSFLQSKNKLEVHRLLKAHSRRSQLALVWQERRRPQVLWIHRASAGWISGALLSLEVVPCRWLVLLWKISTSDKAQEKAAGGHPAWGCALQQGYIWPLLAEGSWGT